jgi:hypothetical protein
VPRADFPELGLNDWLTKPKLIKDIQKAVANAICNVAFGRTHIVEVVPSAGAVWVGKNQKVPTSLATHITFFKMPVA